MNINYMTDADLKALKHELIEDCARIADDAQWGADSTVLAPENVCRITQEAIAERIRKMRDKA